MFRFVLITLALLASHGPLMQRPPDLVGLSTWYGPPAFCDGDTMANGEPLRLGAATLAVDVSRKAWLGRKVLVLTECGELHRARVTDTGRLYEVGGWLRLGIRGDRKQYWPFVPYFRCDDEEPVLLRPVVENNTKWLEDKAYLVVADFPMQFYAGEVACRVDSYGRGDTQRIMIWILPND